ncbi:MAG: hypothetical protein K2N13_09605 [Paraprevotella sp.]|nr:hypothetical protein [Paraprevotella sp.]
MKNLAFLFVAATALFCASCKGNQTNDACCDADSCCGDTIVVEEIDSIVTDSVEGDTVVAEVEAPEAA